MNATNSDPPKGGEEEKEAAVMVRINLNTDKKGHVAAAAAGPRRIVKAAHPKASTSSNGSGAAESRQEAEGVLKALPDKDDDDEDDDELIAKNKHPHHHHRPDPYLLMRPTTTGGADSPILREACQEAADQVKRGQVQSSSDRRKVKSERAKNLVRHPVAPAALEAGAKNGVGTPAVATNPVKANPFSRFLSVFSVEPAHPEHKRRYLSSHSGGSDANHHDEGVDASPLHPPAVKKARTDEDDDNDNDDNEGSFLGIVDATKTTASAAADRPLDDSSATDKPWAKAWTRVASSIQHQIRTRPLVVTAVAVAAAAVWVVAYQRHGRDASTSLPSSSSAA